MKESILYDEADKNLALIMQHMLPKKMTVLMGPPGSGKSTYIRGNMVELGGRDLVFANNHKLLDEYEEALKAAGHDCVHLYGFKQSCWILLNDADSNDAKKIKKMLKRHVFAHLICEEMGCPHASECQRKADWGGLRDENGLIQKTVLVTGNFIILFDWNDFDAVIIEENNEKMDVPKLVFDEKKVINDLQKLRDFVTYARYTVKTRYELLDSQKLDELITAVRNKDTRSLNRFKVSADATIRHFNLHVMNDEDEETGEQKSLDARIDGLCLVSMQSVIMYLEFDASRKKYDTSKKKYELDCAIDGIVRELSSIDAKIYQWLEFQYRLNQHPDQKEVEWCYKMNDEEIKNLTEYKKRLIKGVVSDARMLGIFIDDEKEFTIQDILALKDMTAEDWKLSLQQPKLKINFIDAMFWQHMSSFAPLTIVDSEIQFKKDFFIHDIYNFKRIFPAYKVTVSTLHTEPKKSESRLFLGAYDKSFFRNFFLNEAKKDEQKKVYEHIKWKIRYLVKQGKKVCVLTHKPNVSRNETFCGVPVFWFGSSTGINRFAEFDVLIVLGTYNPGDALYKEMWEKYYMLEQGKMPKIEYIKDEAKRLFVPEDERLRRIHDAFVAPSVYNLVHRVRPMTHPVDIYWYGWNIPEALIQELTLSLE